MTIVFTGGGTGGHFYPLIAITEAIRDIVRERRLLEPRLYFLAPAPFDERALFDNGIGFVRIRAGKMRRYASIRNVTGFFGTLLGTLSAVFTLFRLYPDVVISKGGYGSVPVTLAARILNIPVIIHESDSRPGRANLLAARFAARIAVSFENSIPYFPEKVRSKIARTGIPIRKALMRTESQGARQYLELESGIPTILILGGSLGAMRINDTVLGALTDLVSFANVIHQTGKAHINTVSQIADVALEHTKNAARYKRFDYLDEISLQRAAGAADIIVSRAGSGAIAEISAWKKPAILIPIPEEVSHDQRANAYAFARTGGAEVIEEANLTPHVLASEIRRVTADPELLARMAENGSHFADPDAARVLAEAALNIALSHEPH